MSNRIPKKNQSNSKRISVLAGKPAPAGLLTNIPRLITAYYSFIPDPNVAEECVVFGTSGHRGSSRERTFNELHILAITQAIIDYRTKEGITGPLFIGIDTHALSIPAFVSALEVLAAQNVEVMIARNFEYTPTPVVSYAILKYNRDRTSGKADGIVITPSHNPPRDGGFKYDPPHGGPADESTTNWIQTRANELLASGIKNIPRIPIEKAFRAATTHYYDFLHEYIEDLGDVINMALIRDKNIHIGVDPLGGAGVHYWGAIAERYNLNLTVVNETVDPTFQFMTVDWDGQIRMDPSSVYAMAGVIKRRKWFDLTLVCDTDHDRHGVITHSNGLLPPNHYLSTLVYYLFQHRPEWNKGAAVGKTVVTSHMLDCVAQHLGKKVYEVPVGFKWFVDGLLDSTLGFAGEESAGASLLRMNGQPWTTDKDGIVAALLAAEMSAQLERNPAEVYQELEYKFGHHWYQRVDFPATVSEKKWLSNLTPQQIQVNKLAGEKIETILTEAPGNGAPIGGLKLITKNGWCAMRPSGTESINKIYAESTLGAPHLKKLLAEAEEIVHSSKKEEEPS